MKGAFRLLLRLRQATNASLAFFFITIGVVNEANSQTTRPAAATGIQRITITAIQRGAGGNVKLDTDLPIAVNHADSLLLIASGMTPRGWAKPMLFEPDLSSLTVMTQPASGPAARPGDPERMVAAESNNATEHSLNAMTDSPEQHARRNASVSFIANFDFTDDDEPERLRAWLIRPTLYRDLLPRWPDGVPLTSTIDSIGPGQKHVWLVGGTDHGFSTEQSWWLRLGGQPVARFDTRFVAGDLSFCRVIPLVADAPLACGQTVEAWPTPSDKRDGRVTSAAVFCEERGTDQRVWIAAPPDVGFPNEPQIDFSRGGRYVGHGVVDQRDDAFWYVRVAAKSCIERIAIGDDANVRTLTMIHRREFVAHVFEATPDGYLMDAGETENVTLEHAAFAWRDGRALGQVRVASVQNDYATIRTLPDPSAEPLQRGDEIRFAPAAAAPLDVVAEIREVVGGSIFTAEMKVDRRPSARVPLAVRSGGRVIGAALLIDVADSSGIGFVIGDPTMVIIERGAQLLETVGASP